MDDKFKIEDENGNVSEAEIITTFKYKEKEYILYSIDKDSENSNIYVSILTTDDEGFNNIKDIEDEIEKEEVNNVVKNILSSIE